MSPDEPGRYALLIGIDHYDYNMFPGGFHYPSLGGCVRDILLVERFLEQRFGVPPEHILKLTATGSGQPGPIEPRDQWPTYDNMVAAFKRLADMAERGDQVYIHYSGHGARTSTAFASLKGPTGLDEALVPMDIGRPGARYLRDLELAYLLKSMVDKGLMVTIVLDSCHSGGGTRDVSRATVRRAVRRDGEGRISAPGFVDRTTVPGESKVASKEDFRKMWLGGSGAAARSVMPASGWMLEPEGYTLLAACQSSESAHEAVFDDGGETHGALTYWLVRSLNETRSPLTYRALYDRLVVKVHNLFPMQTPSLEGIGDRVVFGSDQVQPLLTVVVARVDKARNAVMVRAGQSHGLSSGAKLVVYPPGADPAQVAERQALVELTEVGSTESWGDIVERIRPEEIEEGAQAVLLDPGSIELQRGVKVLIDRDDLRTSIEEAVGKDGSGFLYPITGNERPDFQVRVDEKNIAIRNSVGDPIPNLPTAIGAAEGDAPARVVRQLVHLSKFKNVLELENGDPGSPMARKVRMKLIGAQSKKPRDRSDLKPIDDSKGTPSLSSGDWISLCIKNEFVPEDAGARILNICVLDLAPDWSITKIYPKGAALSEPLDPGQEIRPTFPTYLPPGYEEGTDVLKVFATTAPADFGILTLPKLGEPARGVARGMSSSPLDKLFAAVSVDRPRARHVGTSASNGDWATAELEVHLKKG